VLFCLLFFFAVMASFALISEGSQQMVHASEDVTDLFIEVVKSKPFLYDTRHRLYKNVQAKFNAWQEIAGIFQCTGESINSLRTRLDSKCMTELSLA